MGDAADIWILRDYLACRAWRLVGIGALLGLLVAVPVSALAALPVYGGGMTFPIIREASDPEEYSWEVTLHEGQELKSIDDQHAAVYFEDGHAMFSITATSAHDADGTAVPTTLDVSEGNVVTLTVHHRAGDPAAGGVTFDYPISSGDGWEGGFSTVRVVMPPSESESREVPREARLAAPRKVFVRNSLGSDEDLTFRPHRFYLSADGTFGILGVKWKRYGGPVATATGSAYVNDCIPFCAAGHFYRPQARLRLTKIVHCNGDYQYARMSYKLKGRVPSGFPRRGSFSMLPRDEVGEVDC